MFHSGENSWAPMGIRVMWNRLPKLVLGFSADPSKAAYYCGTCPEPSVRNRVRDPGGCSGPAAAAGAASPGAEAPARKHKEIKFIFEGRTCRVALEPVPCALYPARSRTGASTAPPCPSWNCFAARSPRRVNPQRGHGGSSTRLGEPAAPERPRRGALRVQPPAARTCVKKILTWRRLIWNFNFFFFLNCFLNLL